ncbi:NAD(P)-binding domain-containing protein [Mycobacterium sp. AZCC_0083]|uniref:NADPH-dependent F420 reductase n=1 Tax=Mycobacterium sp. AZCC_0083 TaxID=2735882 RepID=UPI001790A591|nr:NAD(P)-binding domain-containing protein [Mycobacterium sp. AZCC_0083]MBB5168622.1 hypothetical protein [Mycobacterium sp. AZCC_0083]
MIDTVGFIGSGRLAQAVAHRLLEASVAVLLSNTRGPDSLIDVVAELGPGARAVTVAEAAGANLVVIAVPFTRVSELTGAVDSWVGRVVVDATNQFAEPDPDAGVVDLGEDTGSEWVARRLPGAVVVKAFNTMFANFIRADPVHPEGRQVVFYAGDDDEALSDFGELLTRLGFAGVLVGSLRDGGRIMQLGGPLSALHVLKQD